MFIWDIVNVSNRIAGPGLPLRHELRELALNRERNSLEFREQDFWKDVAENFNLVRDELLDRRAADQRAADNGQTSDKVARDEPCDEQPCDEQPVMLSATQ